MDGGNNKMEMLKLEKTNKLEKLEFLSVNGIWESTETNIIKNGITKELNYKSEIYRYFLNERGHDEEHYIYRCKIE